MISISEALWTVTKQVLPGSLNEVLKHEVVRRLGTPDMQASLERLAENGFCPNIIIDVGAYHGEWTKQCKSIYPEAAILMVEPQAAKQAGLRKMAAHYAAVTVSESLLGAVPQDAVHFYENESVSSMLPESAKPQQPAVNHRMTTLAAITEGSPFARPDFIKLDVQGYELEILRGGEELVRAAEVLLLEVSLIEVNQGAPLLHEVVAYMQQRGFVLYDICTLIRRPLDRALWQIDALFVRTTSTLIRSKQWN